MKQTNLTIAAMLALASPVFATLNITFEDKALSPQSFYNGSDGAGGFSSGGASFNNAHAFYGSYESWGGFAYSNRTDTTTAGYGNQYSAYAGSGAGGSANFAVGYMDTYTPAIPTITLPAGDSAPVSIDITNTTYTALLMKNGDPSFGVSPFSGPGVSANGPNGDWFKLTISGYDAADSLTGSVDYFLADYRFSNPSQYFLLNAWATVDLSALGTNVSYLKFTLDSSDKGTFGINTPTYFAADNLVVAGLPEPSTALLCGAGGSALLFLLRTRKNR